MRWSTSEVSARRMHPGTLHDCHLADSGNRTLAGMWYVRALASIGVPVALSVRIRVHVVHSPAMARAASAGTGAPSEKMTGSWDSPVSVRTGTVVSLFARALIHCPCVGTT